MATFRRLIGLASVLLSLTVPQVVDAEVTQGPPSDLVKNSLLRFFDVGPEYATAGMAGLASDSQGAVYMVGGVGETPDAQRVLRKFDSSGRLLWTVVPEEAGSHFRQVVVDNNDQLYVISEWASPPAKPRIHKFTQDGDLVWITEIDPPFGTPEFQFLGGQALRVVAHEAGILVATYFQGLLETEQQTRAFQVGSAMSLSSEGLVTWRTNFWPTVDWGEPWPSAEHDVWVWSEFGARVRSLIPDGFGGAYVIGDRRLSFGNEGFYFHLSDQGEAINGAVSLREQLQYGGFLEDNSFRELGFAPVWIAEGHSGLLYISGAWDPLRNSSTLLAITPEGVPVWLSGQPCTEEDIWEWRCGFQQYLHPKVLPDGTLLVMEQVQKTDKGNQINLIHYSPAGKMLSKRALADTDYGLNTQVRGLVVSDNMLWIDGSYGILEFFDDAPPRTKEHGAFILRCPTAVLRSGGDCPVDLRNAFE